MALEWKGVFPAVTTKFNKNDELDLPLFEKNLQAQIQAGVAGIIIGGSLGESSTVTTQELEELVKSGLKIADGKIPVVVNIATGATKEAVALAKQIKIWGAQGIMLLPPMRYKSTPEETVLFFRTVAAATDLPILLYNNPVDYKTEITLDMFEALKDLPTIQAVKESTRDVSNVIRLRNQFGDRFRILCGVDTLTFEELSAGADGLVAGLVCAFPKETVAIYNFIKNKQHDKALIIYRWFMPLLEFDITPQLVQYIKLAEVYTGLGSEIVRAPRLALSGMERSKAVKIIESALANRPESLVAEGLALAAS
ncbi:dihydrodipicolinate synthase family protein [Arachidicoccus ginsenosidivorans]|jgi:4-hydroxy-tetrahydrodipicolinate synthase|uniref:Dihydrodipicolinate synthase family protein n=1 Tax=Arachidicoccus ginsenosidivorans TaxID=496057 RepID=A0A5B8VLW9_9BACT|nr:dihydrodipicolinate synthase family protein [Arachidicoccus ginsenosidivorans]QEC71228.1 dihydrodipicolinate synthase family protein [Arachidicoccus ginsenosidivorans]